MKNLSSKILLLPAFLSFYLSLAAVENARGKSGLLQLTAEHVRVLLGIDEHQHLQKKKKCAMEDGTTRRRMQHSYIFSNFGQRSHIANYLLFSDCS